MKQEHTFKKENRLKKFLRKVKKFLKKLDNTIIINLSYAQEEYYLPIKKSFRVFIVSFFLLFLWGVLLNFIVITNSTFNKIQLYIIFLLILIMGFSLFSTNKVSKSAKKQAKEKFDEFNTSVD